MVGYQILTRIYMFFINKMHTKKAIIALINPQCLKICKKRIQKNVALRRRAILVGTNVRINTNESQK